MGRQVIRQPNGLYALWTTISDGFLVWNATAEEMRDYVVNEAMQAAKESAERHFDMTIAEMGSGTARPYATTWEEALETYETVHGRPFKGKRSAETLV